MAMGTDSPAHADTDGDSDSDSDTLKRATRLAAVAGVIGGFLVILLALGISAGPHDSPLTPQQRFLSNVSIIAVGWFWGSIGAFLASVTDSDFWPPVPEAFVIAGGALVCIGAGAFVRNLAAVLALQLIGSITLIGLAVFLAWGLYNSPWADYSAAADPDDPDHDDR